MNVYAESSVAIAVQAIVSATIGVDLHLANICYLHVHIAAV